MADDNQNPLAGQQQGAQQGAQQGGAQQQGSGQPPLQVKVPDDVQKGVYSNAVSVNVNSNEVVLDFGYLLPNTPAPVIEVVSRINMNQRTAESFLSVLSGAIEDFKKKQAAQPQNPASQSMGPAPMPGSPMGPQPMGPMPMPGSPMGPMPMPGSPMGPQPMGPAPMPSYPSNA